MTEIVNCPRCGSRTGCSTSGYFCSSCDWRAAFLTMDTPIDGSYTMIPTMPYVDHGWDEKASCWAVSLPGAPGCIAQGPTLSHAVHALVELFPKYVEALHKELALASVHPPQEGPGQ